MKWLACVLLLISSVSQAFDINDKGKITHISRVTEITGDIDFASEFIFTQKLMESAGLEGPQLVFINSGGGYMISGQTMIDEIEAVKAEGHEIICIVTGEAASMAFNFLSHCDKRYATDSARLMFHQVFGFPPGLKPSPKNLRKIAKELEKDDAPYRKANAKALHMSLKDYDRYADKDQEWTAKELYKRHYLNGLVKLHAAPNQQSRPKPDQEQ